MWYEFAYIATCPIYQSKNYASLTTYDAAEYSEGDEVDFVSHSLKDVFQDDFEHTILTEHVSELKSELTRYDKNSYSHFSPSTHQFQKDIAENSPSKVYMPIAQMIRVSQENMHANIQYIVNNGYNMNDPKVQSFMMNWRNWFKTQN